MAARLIREPASREFRGARLDRSYPKTAIVLSYLNLNMGGVEESRFPLWEEEGYRYAGRKPDDDDVEGALAAASRVGKARVPGPDRKLTGYPDSAQSSARFRTAASAASIEG
jgi:hypothetical protein